MARPEHRPTTLDANRLGALWATLDDTIAQAMQSQSASKAAILLWLYHWAPVGVVELARVVGLSQPACTRAVDSLVEQGLADRTYLSGKEVRLALTAAGRRAARQLQQQRLLACARLLSALSPPEQALFASLVDKLLKAPVSDRAYARHVCRFCDHTTCDGPLCPIGCQATKLERAADCATR